MIEVVFSPSFLFIQIIEVLKTLVTDVNLRWSKDGLVIQAMDASHVALVELHLLASAFIDYYVDKSAVVGVSLCALEMGARLAKTRNDLLTIRYDPDDENEKDKLEMFVQDPRQQCVGCMSIHLLNLDEEFLTLPDIPYDITVNMESKEFQETIKNLKDLGDSVELSVNSNRVSFLVDEGQIVYQHGENVTSIDIHNDKTLQISFTLGLEYLHRFAKAAKLSSTVELNLLEEQPLAVKYFLSSKDHPDAAVGTLTFYLAPKIQDIPTQTGSPQPRSKRTTKSKAKTKKL